MKADKPFVLALAFTLVACGTTKTSAPRKVEGENLVVKAEPKEGKKQRVQKKTNLPHKKPFKPASSYPTYRSLKGAEATPFINENVFCKASTERNICPKEIKKTRTVRLLGADLIECSVGCETGTGPHEVIAFGKGSNTSFERGKYVKNVRDGKWVRGQFQCEGKKGDENCKEKILSLTNYKSGKSHGEHKKWSSGGTLIRKQTYQNNVPVGEIREWWPNGKKLTVGKFEKGRREGNYQQWHQNGKLSLNSQYIDGRLHGKYDTWYLNGKPSLRSKYESGVPNGEFKQWHSNGKPSLVSRYKNGVLDGKYNQWNLKGKPLRTIRYKKGVLDGKYKQWYVSGKLAHIATYKNGVLDGRYQRWHRNGNPTHISAYKNGKLHGINQLWHRNGKRYVFNGYKNGQLHGKFDQWYENGQLTFSERYKNGLREGSHRRFSQDGARVSSGKYLGGVKIGKWEIFHPGEQRKSVEHYDKKGVANGSFCRWTHSGDLLGCYEMKQGNGTVKEYFSSKQLSHSYPMKNGKKDGKELHFDSEGRLASEVHWKGGKMHGMHTKWDKEGRIFFEIEYRHNQQHGKYYKLKYSEATQGQFCRNYPCGLWRRSSQDGRYQEVQYTSTGTRISEKNYSPTGVLESEWPIKKPSTYERCLKNMLRGACCPSAQNLPPGSRVCPK